MATADGRVRGNPTSMVRRSVYTNAQTHPLASIALAAVAGAAALVFYSGSKRS